MTNRKAPESVLVALCEAVDRELRDGHATADVRAALEAYREATAPLRTETEVVVDIGHHVRACVRHGSLMWTDEEKRKLEDLANEHTAPVPWDAPAPLRTRASVDAEIVTAARSWARSESATVRDTMVRLCSEPTTDEPEAEAADEYDLASDEILQIVRYSFRYNGLHAIPEYALEKLRELCSKTCVGVER